MVVLELDAVVIIMVMVELVAVVIGIDGLQVFLIRSRDHITRTISVAGRVIGSGSGWVVRKTVQ